MEIHCSVWLSLGPKVTTLLQEWGKVPAPQKLTYLFEADKEESCTATYQLVSRDRCRLGSMEAEVDLPWVSPSSYLCCGQYICSWRRKEEQSKEKAGVKVHLKLYFRSVVKEWFELDFLAPIVMFYVQIFLPCLFFFIFHSFFFLSPSYIPTLPFLQIFYHPL